ncbi:MAG TPA: cytochrome P450 [Pseudonocardiaceae bacterium]|nr:cytochrome P450 [Pseudonocardiaceae bacterium]
MTTLPDKRSCPFDPPDEYRTLREREPVSRLEFVLSPRRRNGWLVTTLAEVRAILADPRFSHRQELVALPIPPPFPMDVYAPEPAAPGTFNKMDAPEHTRYRRLLAKHFTVRRIRLLEPIAARIAAELLDTMLGAGPSADLVTAYAEPLATRLMCELVGVPETDRLELLHHLTVVARMRYTLDELIAAITTISGILDRLVTETTPESTGLLGALVQTGELAHDELVNLTWALVGGGFDTTTNMLALGTFALLRHPDQLRRLRAEPGLWDNGIEELLRYLTVSHLGASRCALSDVRIGEHTIADGETVVLALAAANRDPAHFADPDVLDVGRVTQGHVAFGHGVHQCIGQHLARLTMRIGFRALFDRCTDLRLAVPHEQIVLRDDMLHYGVHRLPVTWEVSTGE